MLCGKYANVRLLCKCAILQYRFERSKMLSRKLYVYNIQVARSPLYLCILLHASAVMGIIIIFIRHEIYLFYVILHTYTHLISPLADNIISSYYSTSGLPSKYSKYVFNWLSRVVLVRKGR